MSQYGMPKNTLQMDASEHLTVQENIKKAISQLGQTCVLCKAKATTPVVVVTHGNYAKMVNAPKDGRTRLAIVAVCNECGADPKHGENIKKVILNRLAPDRN